MIVLVEAPLATRATSRRLSLLNTYGNDIAAYRKRTEIPPSDYLVTSTLAMRLRISIIDHALDTRPRYAGVKPIRSSSTSAASTTACRDAPGCAAWFVAVTAAPFAARKGPVAIL